MGWWKVSGKVFLKRFMYEKQKLAGVFTLSASASFAHFAMESPCPLYAKGES